MAYLRLGDTLTQAHLNDLLDALELQNELQHGRGVLSGLHLSTGASLNLAISGGTMIGRSPVSPPSTTMPVPASATVYIWREYTYRSAEDIDDFLTASASSEDIGGGAVCLGQVTTDATSVVSVSNQGRMELGHYSDPRTFSFGPDLIVVDGLNGRVGIGKTPTSEVDIGGLVQVENLQISASIRHPANVETLGATKVMTSADANIQVLTPSGANRTVRLPQSSDLDWGDWFRIVNPSPSGGYSLIVQNAAGTVTIVTLVPQQEATISPTPDSTGASAGPKWPSTATATAVATALTS